MLFHVNHVDCVELFDDILFEGFFHTMPLLIADSAPLQHWDCIQIRLQQKLDWKKVYIHFMKWILNGKLFSQQKRLLINFAYVIRRRLIEILQTFAEIERHAIKIPDEFHWLVSSSTTKSTWHTYFNNNRKKVLVQSSPQRSYASKCWIECHSLWNLILIRQ